MPRKRGLFESAGPPLPPGRINKEKSTMAYRETRSERAASARLHERPNRQLAAVENFKFRWTLFKERELKKRDWYGYINLDLHTAELMHDWLSLQLKRSQIDGAPDEITFMLSGFDNVSQSGDTYVGGIASPQLSYKSLPNKSQRR